MAGQFLPGTNERLDGIGTGKTGSARSAFSAAAQHTFKIGLQRGGDWGRLLGDKKDSLGDSDGLFRFLLNEQVASSNPVSRSKKVRALDADALDLRADFAVQVADGPVFTGSLKNQMLARK